MPRPNVPAERIQSAALSTPVRQHAQKRLAAIQSSYVPWRGYFAVIDRVDLFVLYDDVQYTKNDWRNRNQVKTPHGTLWMTIPVRTTGRFGQRIDEVEIVDGHWAEKHWKTLRANYSRAACFAEVEPHVQRWYELAAEERRLSRVNELFLRRICDLVGIATPFRRSTEFDLPADRNERLIALCEQAGCDEYVSGPAARTYLDQGRFAEHGLAVQWMDYQGLRDYPQLHSPEFVHHVSILDPLFNVGPAMTLRQLRPESGR